MTRTHSLEVKGAASEKRWQQSRHDLFQPVPISIAFVAISTGGKTSQMLTVANALLPIMERVVIFSHSHRLDPAYIDLKDRLKEKALKRGETPEAHPFVYDSPPPAQGAQRAARKGTGRQGHRVQGQYPANAHHLG